MNSQKKKEQKKKENRIKKITEEECNNWRENPTVDPTTNKKISSPDSQDEKSLNYLISKNCYENFKILRKNNNIIDVDNIDKEYSNTNSKKKEFQDITEIMYDKEKENYEYILSLFDSISPDKEPTNEKQYDVLYELLNIKQYDTPSNSNRYTTESANKRDITQWKMFFKNSNDQMKYWLKIMIHDKEYYEKYSNEYFNIKKVIAATIANINEDNFEKTNPELNDNISKKYINYELYFKLLFVLIICEYPEIKHKFFRNDVIFMKFKKLVENIIKKFKPNATENHKLRELLYFVADPYINMTLYNKLTMYIPNLRQRVNINELLINDELITPEMISIDSKSGYLSLENEIYDNCRNISNFKSLKNPIFKKFKSGIIKSYHKYNNSEKFIDFEDFKIFVSQNLKREDLDEEDIITFIKHFEGDKKYEEDKQIYLLKQFKLYRKQKIFNINSDIVANIMKKNLRFTIVIDKNKKYIISLFRNFLSVVNHPNNTKKENFLDFKNTNLNIKYEKDGQIEAGVDAGGPMRQLMSTIGDELFDLNIFVKPELASPELKSDKYFLNPNFDVLKYVNLSDFQEFEDKSDLLVNEFYSFLGKLINFMFVHEFKLKHNLSSYLLSGFINKNITRKNGISSINTKNHEFAFFMIRDFPNFYQYFFNIMNMYDDNQDESFDTYISYSTHMPLTKYYNKSYDSNKSKSKSRSKSLNDSQVNSDVFIENIDSYIYDLSRHIYLHNPLKDSNIDMLKKHILFFNSIPQDLIKVFKTHKITLNEIDEHLTQTQFTREKVKSFVDNVLRNITIYSKNSDNVFVNEQQRIVNEQKEMQTRSLLFENKENFINKLFNDGNSEFFDKLISFWSGDKNYNENNNIKYKININANINADNTKWPSSHTCFYTLDIGKYENFDTFLKELESSVIYSDGVFDMAGGKYRRIRKNIKNKTSTAKRSNSSKKV